jgi:hypothetical protein
MNDPKADRRRKEWHMIEVSGRAVTEIRMAIDDVLNELTAKQSSVGPVYMASMIVALSSALGAVLGVYGTMCKNGVEAMHMSRSTIDDYAERVRQAVSDDAIAAEIENVCDAHSERDGGGGS